MDRIKDIFAREIINARGIPTVEVTLRCESGAVTKAAAPSGISVSEHEAIDLRDGGSRYMGKGVQKAVENVGSLIAPALRGMPVFEQEAIDRRLIELDGTENKSKLGGNAMIATSIAVARAGAMAQRLPLYAYLGTEKAIRLPIVCPNLISGSVTAGNQLDFEDFLVVPYGFDTFAESIRAVVEMFHILNKSLIAACGTIGQITALAPPLRRDEDAFDFLMEAIDKAGYSGKIGLAIDAATSLIYDENTKLYKMERGMMDREEMLCYYKELCGKYPLQFIEDGLGENDYEGFAIMNAELPTRIVGDDIFATNERRLREGAALKAGNGIIIKANQAGTLTETMNVAALAHTLGYTVIASTRSGETADEFQADLAVAEGAKYMKTGCPFRGEMVTKWNRLMEIEEQLGSRAIFEGAVS